MDARMLCGDSIEMLRTLPDSSVHCCVTSPPYWNLRDYGHAGQIGLEDSPEEYVARMVAVFREVRRVLREDGTCWVNLGDSYAGGGKGGGGSFEEERPGWTARGRIDGHGLKPKDLVGIPWRVAFALQADGWYLRQDIIWHKPNPMPESVRDRCTKAHEYVFLLAKGPRYYYDAEAVSEAAVCDRKPGRKITDTRETHGTGGGNAGINALLARYHEGNAPTTRNRRSVWKIATKPYKGAHFAVMPPALVEPCVLAGCPEECCSKCGSGFVRDVEKSRRPTRPGADTKVTGDKMTDGNRDPQRHVTTTTTVGWKPSCKCNSCATTLGVVLDPFAGSGTTLAVAIANGRRGIGIELNPEYIELANKRIEAARQAVAVFSAPHKTKRQA